MSKIRDQASELGFGVLSVTDTPLSFFFEQFL